MKNNLKIVSELIKISAIFLVISTFIFSPLFVAPKKAAAVDAVAVISSVSDALISAGNAIMGAISKVSSAIIGEGIQALKIKEFFLDGIAKALIRATLRGIIQSTLAWVRSGFQGNPAFIQDPKQFLTNIADNEIGRLIYNHPDYQWMCSPFRLELQRALVYGRSFQQQNYCTLSKVVNNFEDFANSTTNQLGNLGGWDAWNNITTDPQNNPYGSYALLDVQLGAKITGQRERQLAQLNWGKGFFSWKDPSCVTSANAAQKAQENARDQEGSLNASEYEDIVPLEESEGNNVVANTDPENCKTITPGSIIADSTNKALDSEIDDLISADEINEALSGLLLSLVQQALGGNGGLAGASYMNGGTDYSAQFAAQERDQFVSSKNELVGQMIGRVDVENNYIRVKNQSIGRVDVSAEKIGSVISCYNLKLGTSSPVTLTQDQRTFAENEIRAASTTRDLILSYKNSIRRDISIANSNVDNLQRLIDAINNLPFEKRDQMQFLSQQFSQLFSQVHNEGEIASAELERDYTLPDRLKDLDSASDQKLQQCNLFPQNNNQTND